jgi:hypothetical protein
MANLLMQDKIKLLCYSIGILVPVLGRQEHLEPLELTYFMLKLGALFICTDSVVYIAQIGSQLRE